MNWDITKSKLYGEIMESVASFFGIADATEAEIHDRLQGQKPFADQIAEATSGNELAEKLESLTAKVDGMAAQIEGLQNDLSARDARIAELQTQVSGLETSLAEKDNEIATLKSRHESEVKALAGQVSALKAGRQHEQDAGGEPHPAGSKSTAAQTVSIIEGGELAAMVQKKRKAAF